MSRPVVCAFALTAALLAAAISSLKINLDPRTSSVTPGSTIHVQVRVYGPQGERLRESGAQLTATGGFISKPYAFQGTDDEPYPERRGFAGVLQSLAQNFVHKDTFLWTAPDAPGKYKLEAALGGIRAETTLEVTEATSLLTPAEAAHFDPEPEGAADSKYAALARHWAPFIAQETWFDPKADIPVRFDYDGDWRGDNNWDNLASGSSQAFVYYTAVETETHWFLIYNLFHPRDYSDTCAPGMCHENDNEGLILAVRKDGSPHGTIDAMETLAHNKIFSYVANARLRPGANSVSGSIRFYEQTHPMIFVESGGHGILGLTPDQPYDPVADRFTHSTGITFVPSNTPGKPAHANDRKVPYALLSIDRHWWERREQPGLFDAPFSYRPIGRRPGARVPSLLGSFLGRKHTSNSARPFWAWYDSRLAKQKILAPGQWALDPAYSMTRTLSVPADLPWATDYIHNPYLADNNKPE